MPAYHSRYADKTFDEACGCALLPLKITKSRGPAPPFEEGTEDDIIDEVMKYYRPNCLFRNYDVKGGVDRSLIYLTLCMQQLQKETEKCAKKDEAVRMLQVFNAKAFPIPGAAGWALGGMHVARVSE